MGCVFMSHCTLGKKGSKGYFVMHRKPLNRLFHGNSCWPLRNPTPGESPMGSAVTCECLVL